ncbi:MAG: type II toxin-antitoxin system RelE/ParE family toxin [Candidatus Omnitrophica bacterium]|nr:type II toxin-antitoxin system RelE/ParE family toxin [Candidatus Omnitrophota bacterium]
MYKLVIKNSAKKELDDIPAAQFLKIDAAILSLKTNPHPFPQSKKLKGEDKCRLRVGDYRVVYASLQSPFSLATYLSLWYVKCDYTSGGYNS